ncbi:HamA C-terminal domain-containing protein [Erwinia amylovora]|uniref:HamA C-terminal domain-containing protein n=1 Tax=Erwinia amylovora TaxID=552 RepID=UPI0014440FCF|nr:DUF1837 domain-containing protein [Erwinia amylovora]
MDFEILFDDTVLTLFPPLEANNFCNNKVISMINDFEDGGWRLQKFHRFVWDNIIETALSFKEREALISDPHSALASAAQNLRLTDKLDDISQGSELAEIFLYGLMKHHFKALPVVPKIFYKQNVQDNAKGADSVHIVIDETGEFTLWFGEAKFYNSIENERLNSITESVKNSLNTDKLRKENSVILNVNDIKELILDDRIKDDIFRCLSNANSIDNIKGKINIPILIIHECNITSKATCISEAYKKEILDFHKERTVAYFRKNRQKVQSLFGYENIKFHLILFPVPNKKVIIDNFVNSVIFYKEQ